MKIIDLESWERAPHYRLFKGLAHPHYAVTVPVEAGVLVDSARERSISAFSCLLYALSTAANQVSAFRMRFRGEDVVEYEIVHPSYAAKLPGASQGVFGYATFEYTDSLAEFDRRRKAAPINIPGQDNPNNERDDLIYCSSLPWLAFTGLTHAYGGPRDAVPRFTLGKFQQRHGGLEAQLCVQVHHAVVDGYHIGQLVETVENICATPADELV